MKKKYLYKYDEVTKETDTGLTKNWNKPFKIRCAAKGCKHYMIVRFESEAAHSVGYVISKKYGFFDLRNFGFVCNQHQKDHDKYYASNLCIDGKTDLEVYGKLKRNRTLC